VTSSKTKYSLSAAARIADKSRTTIASHIKSGKLSVTTSPDGNRLVDASELIRVYGDECDFDRARRGSKPASNTISREVTNDEQRTPTALHTVRQLLESERKERDREREQLQARIDHLEDSLKRSQEGHNRATLLLENRTSGVGDLENSFRTLEARIANQEDDSRKERQEIKNQAKRKIDHFKRALEEEQNKSVWQRLFA